MVVGDSPSLPVDLPDSVRERARWVSVELLREDRCGVSTSDNVFAGCLCAVCKETDAPVTAREIAAVEECSVESVFGVSRCVQNTASIGVTPVESAVFVKRFLDELGIDEEGGMTRSYAVSVGEVCSESVVGSGRASSPRRRVEYRE
jgi:transcription initiation factor TFIIIB Brf1 subunit/transcription initiation factor TFIIB